MENMEKTWLDPAQTHAQTKRQEGKSELLVG